MCLVCQAINNGEYIYKDNNIAIIPSPMPCCKGHLLVVPIEHKVILEQLRDEVFASMMIAANKFSMLLFELLHPEGTNILVRNGLTAGQEIDHIAVEIIPRTSNDGINLSWNSKQRDLNELARNAEELRLALEQLNTKPQPKQEKKEEEKKQETITRLNPRIP